MAETSYYVSQIKLRTAPRNTPCEESVFAEVSNSRCVIHLGGFCSVVHLFIGSKVSWEPMPLSGVLHEEMPALAEILKGLHV